MHLLSLTIEEMLTTQCMAVMGMTIMDTACALSLQRATVVTVIVTATGVIEVTEVIEIEVAAPEASVLPTLVIEL